MSLLASPIVISDLFIVNLTKAPSKWIDEKHLFFVIEGTFSKVLYGAKSKLELEL